MKKQSFKNICDILNEISPHSKEVKKFLLTRQSKTGQSAEKSHTVEAVIENIMENIDSEIETDDRNLVLNGEDSKLKELEEFLERNNDVDLDMDAILNKLNEIKNEINVIKENEAGNEQIEEIKNNFQDEKDNLEKNEEEKKENKEKQELEEIEKEDDRKKEETERVENEKIDKEEKETRDEEDKATREENAELELNEETKRKYDEEQENIGKEGENKGKNEGENEWENGEEKADKNQDQAKTFLDKIGETPENIEDISFINKILEEKDKIQNAKDILEANSVKDVSSGKQKVNEIDNEIKRIEGMISDLQSLGIDPPADLLSQLESLSASKGSIEGAINTLSTVGLSK